MRTLEECTAEVFYRSEKKICRRRKVRKQLLCCGIPLFLCVVLCAGLPVLTARDKSAEKAENQYCGGEILEYACESWHAEVSTSEGKIFLDSDAAEQLFGILDDCLQESEAMAYGADPDNESGEATDPARLYGIEITMPDGESRSYSLSGNLLSYADAQVVIDKAQQKEIEKLLDAGQ